ncbi:hypothetical protein KM043_012464 [Ampulex compressa]|nr:hypothetical protein KM043_012464 [Ampulex compressa]
MAEEARSAGLRKKSWKKGGIKFSSSNAQPAVRRSCGREGERTKRRAGWGLGVRGRGGGGRPHCSPGNKRIGPCSDDYSPFTGPDRQKRTLRDTRRGKKGGKTRSGIKQTPGVKRKSGFRRARGSSMEISGERR